MIECVINNITVVESKLACEQIVCVDNFDLQRLRLLKVQHEKFLLKLQEFRLLSLDAKVPIALPLEAVRSGANIDRDLLATCRIVLVNHARFKRYI